MPHKHGAFRLLDEAEVPVGDLVDDRENANVHDEDQIAVTMGSLKRFGQPARIVVRKCDRVVFDGNGRLEAARRLGSAKIRVQHVEGSDAECRAYSIVANESPRLSRWDTEQLAGQLKALQESGDGLLEASGYSEDRLADLIAELEAPDFKDLSGGIPETGAEDPTKTRCPACGHAFHPGEKAASVKGREYREQRRKAAKAEAE